MLRALSWAGRSALVRASARGEPRLAATRILRMRRRSAFSFDWLASRVRIHIVPRVQPGRSKNPSLRPDSAGVAWAHVRPARTLGRDARVVARLAVSRDQVPSRPVGSPRAPGPTPRSWAGHHQRTSTLSTPTSHSNRNFTLCFTASVSFHGMSAAVRDVSGLLEPSERDVLGPLRGDLARFMPEISCRATLRFSRDDLQSPY
jgi:hypothetical protein